MNDLLKDTLQDFDTLPVAFLLQGQQAPYVFQIPSFQRGYRWEEKHVIDMLDDIYNFVSQDNKEESYFLQPLVVRRGQNKNEWEVLDGQQRLTTMLLILKQFIKRFNKEEAEDFQLYTVNYIERVTPNFDSLCPFDNIDSFYLMKAQQKIIQWCEEKKDYKRALRNMAEALFYRDNEKKVKFIWYVVSEENKDAIVSDLSAIKVFNRLNKGKISLTSSELIKALFYIKFKSTTPNNNQLNVDRFSMEWDIMEKQFEKDDFWYFISDRRENVGTRMDVLFDYVADVDYQKTDPLEAYRFFQKKYDNASNSFEHIWEEVKKVYDMFLRWYEDNRIYNYVGYLVWKGMLPQHIKAGVYKTAVQMDEDLLIKSLQELIKSKINCSKYCIETKRPFEEWEYSTDLSKIREMLLLFNIESYNKSNLKFPFEQFKKKEWDVEHVDSQKDNNMQELKHKIEWINLVIEQLQYDPMEQAKQLMKQGKELLDKFKTENQDSNNVFKDFYDAVYKYYNSNIIGEEKDTIDNLALLNCGINRSYKNAPFSCKRSIIIQNDKNGVFIPLCTRNLFLKYYTGAKRGSSQLDIIRWNETDRQAYKEQLFETLKFYL